MPNELGSIWTYFFQLLARMGQYFLSDRLKMVLNIFTQPPQKTNFHKINPTVSLSRYLCIFNKAGRPPVGELKKVGKSRIFWQKVGGFFTKVGKGRIIFSLF